MKMNPCVRSGAPIVMLSVVLLLTGCATTPRTDEDLERARSVVQSAASDPAAMRYAALDVQRARELLAEAEEAQKRRDREELEHKTYLAERTARVALERGRARTAEQRVANADVERQRIQVQIRDAEARRSSQQLAQAQQQLQQTREQLTQSEQEVLAQQAQLAEARESPRGLVLTLGDVLFDSGRSELKSGADRTLQQLVDFLRQNPERRIVIEGFTDSVGSEALNMELSERRAQAVREALVRRGAPTDRIEAHGYGEGFPVAENTSPGGRQLNRRVEIIVSRGADEVPPRGAQVRP